MKAFDDMQFNTTSEQLVQILCDKTQNDNPTFFRVLIAYYFCLVASMMRVSIKTIDRGVIPINLYALNLSGSGSGKGYSTSIMEEQVINRFRERFLDNTFEIAAMQTLPKIAHRKSVKTATDYDKCLASVEKEFARLGPLVFSFDSGTTAAVKQMRHKILMAELGSVNLQIDEIGSNLVGNTEVLNTYLELFDMGIIKQKLIKNTDENQRHDEIVGKTPTNMLLFGTPAKLLDGGKIEEELYGMLEIGYARRCFFGYSRKNKKRLQRTVEEIYAEQTNPQNNEYLEKLSEQFEKLADPLNSNRTLNMSQEASMFVIAYKLECEQAADKLPDHEDVRKIELSHRYFKALKLAGAYAFIDNCSEVTIEHLEQAIKVAEESGKAFYSLLTREPNWVRLAHYLAAVDGDLTQSELMEALPFYRGTAAARGDMLTLAISYGHKNNIIIKKSFETGVEFLRGESLAETDLSKMIFSYSTDLAEHYRQERQPWEKLYRLMQAPGLHWANHHFKNDHRLEDHAIPGFNMVVIDVDKGDVPIVQVQELLKDYKFLLHTTKRHTEEFPRFRLIFPTSHEIKLDTKDFKEFMTNVYDWLPFSLTVDRATNQRNRKWLTHPGQYIYNDGQLLDVLPFIPKTSKEAERKAKLLTQSSMNNLERWILSNSGDGNRNNMLLRYAMILADTAMYEHDIQNRVLELNKKLDAPLEDTEIMTTVFVTLGKKIKAAHPDELEIE